MTTDDLISKLLQFFNITEESNPFSLNVDKAHSWIDKLLDPIESFIQTEVIDKFTDTILEPIEEWITDNVIDTFGTNIIAPVEDWIDVNVVQKFEDNIVVPITDWVDSLETKISDWFTDLPTLLDITSAFDFSFLQDTWFSVRENLATIFTTSLNNLASHMRGEYDDS